MQALDPPIDVATLQYKHMIFKIIHTWMCLPKTLVAYLYMTRSKRTPPMQQMLGDAIRRHRRLWVQKYSGWSHRLVLTLQHPY